MVRRALCVGCNYPGRSFALAGAVNDAFLLAECLTCFRGFESHEVRVLHDEEPGSHHERRVEVTDGDRAPTRANILQQLHWLTRGARPGDVLFFSFSGVGLLVDDATVQTDEGYDEAVLPGDAGRYARGDASSVIYASEIHDIVTGVPKGCSITLVMDADHATSVVDVAGTLDAEAVPGVRFDAMPDLCGIPVRTSKMEAAAHRHEVWESGSGLAAHVRPRFHVPVEIDPRLGGPRPWRPAMSRSGGEAFCYSAASHGQTAVEFVPSGSDRAFGVLTFCFATALGRFAQEAQPSHLRLLAEVRGGAEGLRMGRLPSLDQKVLFTFAPTTSDPGACTALEAMALPAPTCRSAPSRGVQEGLAAVALAVCSRPPCGAARKDTAAEPAREAPRQPPPLPRRSARPRVPTLLQPIAFSEKDWVGWAAA